MTTQALPADVRERRHKWGDPVTHMEGTATGCEETHRECSLCQLKKITVHPPHGFPWREWQHRDGMRAQLTTTPPCIVGNGEVG